MVLTIFIASTCILAVVTAAAITYAVGCSKRKVEEIRAMKESIESIVPAKIQAAEQAAIAKTRDEMQKLLLDAEVRARVNSATQELQEKNFVVLLDARIEAASEAAATKAKQELLDSFHPEIQYFQAQEGVIWKKYYLVVKERLWMGTLPLMGWIEHKTQIAEKLDQQELKAAAEAAAIILKSINPTPNLSLPSGVGRILGRSETVPAENGGSVGPDPPDSVA